MIKLGAELFGLVGSGLGTILAVGESAPITYSAVVAFLGCTGLLIRQVVGSQRLLLQVIEAKDQQTAAADLRADQAEDREHYLRWELDTVRFQHGDRTVDPGPYVPRVHDAPSLPPGA